MIKANLPTLEKAGDSRPSTFCLYFMQFTYLHTFLHLFSLLESYLQTLQNMHLIPTWLRSKKKEMTYLLQRKHAHVCEILTDTG